MYLNEALLQLSRAHSSSQSDAEDLLVSPTTSCGFPNDTAEIEEPIRQVILNNYPKGENNRAFVADWFKRFKWLQYSVKRMQYFVTHANNFYHTEATKRPILTQLSKIEKILLIQNVALLDMKKQRRIFKQCLYGNIKFVE